ncbi:hypothetical protein ACFMQL_20355 [Nonomuraea fastidiosa]|uniref:hypothetical protein n=1 Tax=Nonomuraea fastidiosa TaxID=46173 RepID=UPI00366C80C1
MHSRSRSRRSGGDAEGGGAFVLGAVAVLSVLVAAALFGGDEDDEAPQVVADCVIARQEPDGTYQVVDDRFCADGGSHAAYYYWLYGSSTTDRPGYVRGGTTKKPAAHAQITTRSGKVIQRGGFGSSRGGKGGGG